MKTWAEMTERERDVLVAQALGHKTMQDEEGDHISGWEDDCGNYPADNWMMDYPDRTDDSWQLLPHFSTDRAAAMTLLDGVAQFDIKRRVLDDGTVRYWCRVSKTDKKPWFDDFDCGYAYGVAVSFVSVEDVICRAFLRAKGINIE